jgi:glycosyltransferase involved in cell wall biosynthesis
MPDPADRVISVIIPAWNAAERLAETLASIAAQTLPADEVLVVDDGSTDSTAAVAKAAGARVLRQARQGPGAAMNAGIAATRGDLIAWLEDDDRWAPTKLALQAAALADDHALAGVFGQFRCFGDAALDGTLHVPEAERPGWLCGALLIRRSAQAVVGPFDPAAAGTHFIDWMDRARLLGLRFAMLPDTVLHRRIRLGSFSTPSARRDAAYVRTARSAIARRRALGLTS